MIFTLLFVGLILWWLYDLIKNPRSPQEKAEAKSNLKIYAMIIFGTLAFLMVTGLM